jgi:hypothetical protein
MEGPHARSSRPQWLKGSRQPLSQFVGGSLVEGNGSYSLRIGTSRNEPADPRYEGRGLA